MIIKFKSLKFGIGLFIPSYNLDFGNFEYVRRQHQWKNAKKSYFKLLLLGKVSEVWYQLQYHHRTKANFVNYANGIINSNSDSDDDSNSNKNNENNDTKKLLYNIN